MLTIHPEQMTLKIAQEPGFVDWYSNDFMAEHLSEFHALFDNESLHEMVKNGRKEALNHGFKDPTSQVHFVTLMWHIGPDFHQFPGFQEIAHTSQQAEPERIDHFYQVSDTQWDDAVRNSDNRHWFREAAQ